MAGKASPLKTWLISSTLSKVLGVLLSVAAGAALMAVVHGPLTNESLHELETRLIVAVFPGLIAVGFALGAIAAFSRRTTFAWWALACLSGSIVYAAVVIAVSGLVF